LESDVENQDLEAMMPYLFSTVGMIVMNWTFVENALDYWTAIAFQDHGGSKLEAEMPRQFDRKVRFLRRAFARLPSLAAFRDEALSHVNRAKQLSNVRHYVVHGCLGGFDAETETFTFSKIDVDQDKINHVVGQLRITGTDLNDAADELLEMARTGQQLTFRILETPESKYRPA
jgi:hypothetical protein